MVSVPNLRKPAPTLDQRPITTGQLRFLGSTQLGKTGETYRHHMHIDLLRAMALLTPAQRRLCLILGPEGLSIKEAAEQLRIPRGTLYEEIKRIRNVFAVYGLGDYLKG
jgi:RNA polymerase sigma-70 factor (ECF subfamily)